MQTSHNSAPSQSSYNYIPSRRSYQLFEDRLKKDTSSTTKTVRHHTEAQEAASQETEANDFSEINISTIENAADIEKHFWEHDTSTMDFLQDLNDISLPTEKDRKESQRELPESHYLHAQILPKAQSMENKNDDSFDNQTDTEVSTKVNDQFAFTAKASKRSRPVAKQHSFLSKMKQRNIDKNNNSTIKEEHSNTSSSSLFNINSNRVNQTTSLTSKNGNNSSSNGQRSIGDLPLQNTSINNKSYFNNLSGSFSKPKSNNTSQASFGQQPYGNTSTTVATVLAQSHLKDQTIQSSESNPLQQTFNMAPQVRTLDGKPKNMEETKMKLTTNASFKEQSETSQSLQLPYQRRMQKGSPPRDESDKIKMTTFKEYGMGPKATLTSQLKRTLSQSSSETQDLLSSETLKQLLPLDEQKMDSITVSKKVSHNSVNRSKGAQNLRAMLHGSQNKLRISKEANPLSIGKNNQKDSSSVYGDEFLQQTIVNAKSCNLQSPPKITIQKKYIKREKSPTQDTGKLTLSKSNIKLFNQPPQIRQDSRTQDDLRTTSTNFELTSGTVKKIKFQQPVKASLHFGGTALSNKENSQKNLTSGHCSMEQNDKYLTQIEMDRKCRFRFAERNIISPNSTDFRPKSGDPAHLKSHSFNAPHNMTSFLKRSREYIHSRVASVSKHSGQQDESCLDLEDDDVSTSFVNLEDQSFQLAHRFP